MVITPKINPGRTGYRATFRNPLLDGRVVACGLGNDEAVALEICRDLCDIFSVGIRDAADRRLFGFHPRAVAILFGERSPAAQASAVGASPLSGEDIGELSVRIAARFELGDDRSLQIAAMLERFQSALTGELHEQIRALQGSEKLLRARAETAEYELARSRRERNTHIRATVGEAVSAWKEFYLSGREHITFTNACTAVDSFVSSLPKAGAFRLADIEAAHVDEWVLKLVRQPKTATGGTTDLSKPLSALTKKSMLRRVGSCLTWVKRKYKLHTNPADDVEPVAGACKNPEQIVAIRRLADIAALLDGLKPLPYWRALVATALFTGARYAELIWMRLDQVYLDEEYIYVASRAAGKRVKGTKTGRERRISIERTTFRAILKEHVETRRRELRGKATGLSCVAATSPWLFPTTIDETETHTPRRKSLAGMWSDNGVFSDAWKKAVDGLHTNLAGKLIEPAEYWRYGPSEWRHTFGSILGHCGWSSLEISHVMGNSEDVARRYYIVPGHGGKRWPFEF